MKTASYPRIGSVVSYIRQGSNGQPVEGSGVVQGIILDPNKRLMVHLGTDETDPETGNKLRQNVHVSCLFPSDDFKASFKATLEAAQKLGEEGNGEVKKVVAEYNQRVSEAQAPVLGDAVVFDE